MKISLNWLKNYIDLQDVTVEEIEKYLTTAGLEVEEIDDSNVKLDKFVVGFVKDKHKHPNADKLSVCIVNDGIQDLQVVCGAPNVDKGQRIVFAKEGAIVPVGGYKIEKTKIRGEISNGMICSEREIGLSDNHDGIMVLDDNIEIGTPVSQALQLDDVVFEISITPNRADALSHFGVARDLSALLNRKVIKPEIKLSESQNDVNKLAKVVVENTKSCPRYVARVVTDVEIKESPLWMQKYLKAIGLRPINNIVDITNFVLHETGQPLHAFDLDKLNENTIVVKDAADDEKFTTLDSKERKLSSKDLMICDAQRSVAIAGVMGGENSEVTSSTKNILIESAFFNPSSIRKTAKKVGLSTDASYRFERGCDPEMTVFAAERCAQLIAEYAGGKIASGMIDVYPEKLKARKARLRFTRVFEILGYKVENEKIENILTNLGFVLNKIDDNTLEVGIPSFRHDIEREIDLIEEIARINGYDNIPLYDKINVTLDVKTDESVFVSEVREIMVGLGFNEIITNSLMSEDIASGYGKSIKVLNPSSFEMSNLRPNLIHGMLNTISKNIKVRENNLKLFEIGHIFNPINDSFETFDDFTESENLLIAICGKRNLDEWYQKENYFDFYDLKGFVEELICKKSLDKELKDLYNKDVDSVFEYSFSKTYQNQTIGFGGKVKKDVLKNYDINENVFLFDFNLDKLKEIKIKEKKFDELLKYPKMVRDFAFVIEKSLPVQDITAFIRKNSSHLLKNVNLFDLFEHESLGKNKKSIAFSLEYFDKARTLTEEEVDKDFWNIIELVKKHFNAELRGK